MSDVVRCFFCGAFVQKEDRFCWGCGRDLALPEAQPGPAARELEEQLTREEWLKLRRAYLMQNRGNAEAAERMVRELLQAKPGHVPSLALLAELQRARGDLVGAVQTTQLASEAAAVEGRAPPGALRAAREERAEIQEDTIREVLRGDAERASPLGVFAVSGPGWYQRSWFLAVLAAAGAAALFVAMTRVMQGQVTAYLWMGASLLMAGWTYHDAEASGRLGLLWGPLVLALGPFGLAIYLLSGR